MPTGEEIQLLGTNGSQRAKRWLESTCRAEVTWNNPKVGVSKLRVRKAGASSVSTQQKDYFSFDLGGNLLGGDAGGKCFLAEVKNYSTSGDQGTQYRDFLAKCYCTEIDRGDMIDYFLWITWAPFLVSSWRKLLDSEFIKSSILATPERKYTALGSNSYEPKVGKTVSDKLLIVVLAEGQETLLSLHDDELTYVRQALLKFRENM